MEYTFTKTTNADEIFNSFDGKSQIVVTFESDVDLETVKSFLARVSELPENGFKFFDVRLKALSSEDKAEALKFIIKEQLCVANLLETIVLLINSSNNYNPEFFNNPGVFFSSTVDYLDVCDALEQETNEVREKVVYYFLAAIKSYVNHPRFILNESSNYESMPRMYECIMMLLDFFNISFIMNTPGLKVPDFSEIPSNLKAEIKLVDLWADKQKFVVSTLSELSQVITEKLSKQESKTEEAE